MMSGDVCGGTLSKLVLGASILLTIGYVTINFTTDLPKFLVGENLLLAIGYAYFSYSLFKGHCGILPFLALFASFNAGRVSRSIISPTGEIGPLALAHIPLQLVILFVAVGSAYLSYYLLKQGP